MESRQLYFTLMEGNDKLGKFREVGECVEEETNQQVASSMDDADCGRQFDDGRLRNRLHRLKFQGSGLIQTANKEADVKVRNILTAKRKFVRRRQFGDFQKAEIQNDMELEKELLPPAKKKRSKEIDRAVLDEILSGFILLGLGFVWCLKTLKKTGVLVVATGYRGVLDTRFTATGPGSVRTYEFADEMCRVGLHSRPLNPNRFSNRMIVNSVDWGLLPVRNVPMHFGAIFFNRNLDIAFTLEIREGEGGRVEFAVLPVQELVVDGEHGTFDFNQNGQRLNGELYEKETDSASINGAIRHASESCSGIYTVVGSNSYSGTGHVLNHLNLLPQDKLRLLYVLLKTRCD